MSQNPSTEVVQIEKRKAIVIIAAAVIVATALGGGLSKVGAGFAARNTNGITVTGSAKTSATADNAVWTLSVSLTRPTVAAAVEKVQSDVDARQMELSEWLRSPAPIPVPKARTNVA